MTDSSTVTEDQGVTAESPAANETPGETVLDAIKAGLGQQEAPPASDEGQPPAATAKAEAEQPKADTDPSEEELKAEKPRTAERIRALIAQRQEVTQQAEQFREAATKFTNLQTFVVDNGLQETDVTEALEFLALVKKDPAAAYERLQPIAQKLRGQVGEDLPPDLSEQVRLGYVTEPVAKELARRRAESDLVQQREQETQHRAAIEQQAQAHKALVDASVAAVNTWEARLRASDPDWTTKADRVRERLELDVRRLGRIPTQQETLQMADKAYEAITNELRRYAPARTNVRVPSGQPSGRTVAEPKTMLDAIKLGLTQVD